MGRRPLRDGPYAVGDEAQEVRLGVILHQRRDDRRRQYLEASGRVRAAALVASTFHLDPVEVLAERDPLRRLIRIAAHNVIQTEANKRPTPGR